MRTAGIFRYVTSDAACHLARWVRRVVQAVWRGGLRNVQIDDAGLHNRDSIFGIDRKNAVHPLKLDDDPALHCYGTSAQAGPGSAGNKRNAVFIRDANDLGDLFGRLRKNDYVRLVFKKRE